MAELVDQPLRSLCLFHDPLAIILSDGSGQFVIVHGGSVLSQAPETSYANAVLNLEHATTLIQPTNA